MWVLELLGSHSKTRKGQKMKNTDIICDKCGWKTFTNAISMHWDVKCPDCKNMIKVDINLSDTGYFNDVMA